MKPFLSCAGLLLLVGLACRANQTPETPTPQGTKPNQGHGSEDHSKASPQESGGNTTGTAQKPESDFDTSGTFDGVLSPLALQEAFSTRKAELLACYETAKGRNRFLEGELSVRVEILSSGAAKDIFVQRSTFGDEALESCFAAQVAQLRFPAPKGGSVLAEYPFVYHPEAQVPSAGAPRENEAESYQAKAAAALSSCRDLPESFSAAVWIDGSGKALSAGYGSPSVEGQKARSCVVKALLAAKYPKSKRAFTWLVARDE